MGHSSHTRWSTLVLLAAWLFLVALPAVARPDQEAAELFEQAQRAFRSGDAIGAEEAARKIIDRFDEADQPLVIARTERLLAAICASHSLKSEEINHLIKSAVLFEKAKATNEVAESQRLLGQYYLHVQLLSEASHYMDRALAAAKAQHDTMSLIKIISNQAQLAYVRRQHLDAIQCHERAIALANKIKFKQGLLDNWDRLSYVYLILEQPQRALACMKNAVRYLQTNRDTLGIIYGDLGFAYATAGQNDSAFFFFQKGLNYLDKGRNRVQQGVIYYRLYELRAHEKKFEEALMFLEKHRQVLAQIYTDDWREQSGYANERYKALEKTMQTKRAEERDQKLIIALTAVAFLAMAVGIFVVRLKSLTIRTKENKENLRIVNKQLARSEHLYRNIFENNLANIATHTLEGVIVDINQSGVQTFGLSRDQIVGRSFREFIHPDHRQKFEQYLKEIKEKGTSKGWVRFVDVQGEGRIFRYENKIMRMGDDALVIGFAQDQSDLFDARRAKARQQRQLELIMDSSPDLVTVIDANGTIKYQNRSDGQGTGDITGQKMLQVLPSRQANIFYANLRKVFESVTELHWEQVLENKHYLTKLIPITPGGKEAVKEVLAIRTDITTIKNVESEIKMLSTIVQQSKVGVLITNAHGTATWVNDGFLTNAGLKKKDILGQNPWAVLQTPETEKPKLEYVREQVATRMPFTIDVKHLKPDGTAYWINLVAQPVIEDLNTFQGYFYIQHNVTHEKEMMAEVMAAKEEAENSNRLKTIFLGNLSHEVRTPLQGILGFAEILENPQLSDAKRKEYLNIIKRRTADMQNVIESLLDLASYETGEIKAFPVTVNLHEAVTTTFQKTKQDVDWAGRRIEMNLENKLQPNELASIDPQHLYQVLTNLLQNALKFTNTGTLTLRAESGASFYHISVIDTGIGISDDKMEQIFKPFRQAHEGFSRAKGGIGLGLSICKIMVELWGGTIVVESAIGRGSTFSFTIPKKSLI